MDQNCVDSLDPSELITVTGTKANCELAKEQLLKIQNDIANVITQDVSVLCHARVTHVIGCTCGYLLYHHLQRSRSVMDGDMCDELIFEGCFARDSYLVTSFL